MIGWVLRTFATRKAEPRLLLYKIILLPHLEYCCQVWFPVSLGSIRRLESVQRTFTVRLEGLRDLNYFITLLAGASPGKVFNNIYLEDIKRFGTTNY